MKSRSKKGFTLVELMVGVLIVGILASVALPNYYASKNRASMAAVKENAHSVQVAAESYATDCGGTYPANASDMDPFFPGGNNVIGGSAGHRPLNPLTDVAELPFPETIADSATISAVRLAPPSMSPGAPGQVGYNQCNANGNSFAVTGTDEGGRRIAGPNNGTIVLSNQ